MAVAKFDPVAEIQHSFQVLTKNWMLAVPTAVASLIATIYAFTVLGALFATIGLGAALDWRNIADALGAFTGFTGIGALFVIVVQAIASAMVMASSEDAWNGRQVDLAGALGRATACLGHILLAGLVICVLAVFAIVLPILGWIILGYLMLYVMPAIVVGGRGAFEAIGESYRLATRNAPASITAFIGIVLAVLASSFINNLFIHAAGLNFVIGLVVGGFFSAFVALVSVRFYDLLRTAPPMQAAPPPSA